MPLEFARAQDNIAEIWNVGGARIALTFQADGRMLRICNAGFALYRTIERNRSVELKKGRIGENLHRALACRINEARCERRFSLQTDWARAAELIQVSVILKKHRNCIPKPACVTKIIDAYGFQPSKRRHECVSWNKSVCFDL